MGRPTVKTVQGAQAFDLVLIVHVTLRKRTGSAFSLNGNGEPIGRDVGRSSHDQGLPVAPNATSDYGMPLYEQESPTFSFNPVGSGGGSKATTEQGAGYVQGKAFNSEMPNGSLGDPRKVWHYDYSDPSRGRIYSSNGPERHQERVMAPDALEGGRKGQSTTVGTAGTYHGNLESFPMTPSVAGQIGEPYGRTPPYGERVTLCRQPDGNFKMVQEDYPLAFNDGRPRGGDNDSINSRIVSQVESVLSENLKTIAPTNAKKAQIRLNMGYRMPRYGYLKSFWLLPPQWQKERPADLPIGSDDLAINEAQLEFVKHR
ncbi:hypothetical protein Pmar_PMAR021330, partial [Perkinsus marinus ATCC 50983]